MKALISPNENVLSYDRQTILGSRVAQICDESFDVALPLFWVDYDLQESCDRLYYLNGQINIIPDPPVDSSANTDSSIV